MKIYGVMRYAFFSVAPPEETLCKKCYDARFITFGKPTPLARRILGYANITKLADAQGVHCDTCKKELA